MKKYKIICKTNGEEHLCEKINIDGFDYYLGGNLSPKDLYAISDISGNYRIYQCTRIEKDRVYYGDYNLEVLGDKSITSDCIKYTKKIIATNNPNIDVPLIVNEQFFKKN